MQNYISMIRVVKYLAFNAAIDELYANGCTVICDDIGWYNEPFFEDGIVACHIKTVLSGNQIIYVSATGNDADVHYQGNFYSYSVLIGMISAVELMLLILCLMSQFHQVHMLKFFYNGMISSATPVMITIFIFQTCKIQHLP